MSKQRGKMKVKEEASKDMSYQSKSSKEEGEEEDDDVMAGMGEGNSEHAAALALSQKARWIEEQEHLKKSLVYHDHFPWKYVSETNNTFVASGDKHMEDNKLQFVGGVDLSFCKEDASLACGALVVLEMQSLNVVYKDFDTVHLNLPYIPGFLAFRESPVLLKLLRKMRKHKPALFPQLLMVDGNGILHPRGLGLASHLGVLADLPTIGIGKNLHHVDGLNNDIVKDLACKYLKKGGDSVNLVGKSGIVLGAALRSKDDCTKPVFISIGHRVSLDTAVEIVQACCIYRLPEPVRQDPREKAALLLVTRLELGLATMQHLQAIKNLMLTLDPESIYAICCKMAFNFCDISRPLHICRFATNIF